MHADLKHDKPNSMLFYISFLVRSLQSLAPSHSGAAKAFSWPWAESGEYSPFRVFPRQMGGVK